MKTPSQWLSEDDQVWIDDPASIIERIQREAFAAGFREAAETTARGIDGHAAKLGSNLAVPMLPSIPRGLSALAGVARELGADPAAIAAAWKRIGTARPHITEKRSA